LLRFSFLVFSCFCHFYGTKHVHAKSRTLPRLPNAYSMLRYYIAVLIPSRRIKTPLVTAGDAMTQMKRDVFRSECVVMS
jgi:hypothetical protein